MDEIAVDVNYSHLPFYITAPGESDVLFTAVTLSLIAILIGFGALYFTIQAIPDRLVKGTSKTQMQLVGLLGLISLFTMNNLYWVAAILLAAIRIPDFMAPLTDIAHSLRSGAGRTSGAAASDNNESIEDPAAVTDSRDDGESAEDEPANTGAADND
jgi:multisubunit Na+/H+ antiporter MnhF subunit